MLTAGLILSPVSFSANAASSTSNNPSDHAFDNKVIKKIKVDNMYDNIALLSKQPRVAGTEGEYEAVQYIKNQFEEYGYDTELQPFTMYDWDPGVSTLSIEGGDFTGDTRSFYASANESVTSQLEFVGLASPEEVSEDVKGKIALIERGQYTFYEKIENVLEKGAIGVVMYNAEGQSGNNFGSVYLGQDIPAIALTREDGLELVERLQNKEITATLSVENANFVAKTSYNVIAKKEPHPNKDNGQIVTVGAHHDSVPNGPGANDDASGVAATLELARILAKTPTDTELRFVTFGAEERGLLGSYHYADTLSDEEIENSVAHFQLDMVGSKDAGDLIMFTPDGEKNLVTDIGASAGARISEVVDYGQLGRSDHVPFFEKGIPSALFIHAPFEPWYHSPEDTLDKISKEKLQNVAEIVGASVYQIARPDTPALENSNVAPSPADYDFDYRPL